jgi:lipopolysaccharide/colanic/teichoic acid biosynthesis glycosyltransferase
MKRFFDFNIAFLGLLLLSPFIIAIGVLIKFSDKGPVFFKHKRVGKDGKIFRLYKFRSMRFKKSAENGGFEPGNISQITSVGKILRRTKIDELPQLINVLRGDLTLVGPRPEVRKWTKVYPEKWAVVLSVKPGITDYASIKYRNEEEILASSNNPENTYFKEILPQKLDLNIEYVNQHSILKDLNIIFQTLYVIIFK